MTDSDKQVHEGSTEKAVASLLNQQQEPEPSQDANVCAAYWVARQMLDGPVDGFSREAWHDALSALVDALYSTAKPPDPDARRRAIAQLLASRPCR